MTLPAPLTPPEADLRNYPYMPLFRSRLFGSSFHARATDAEWRAGVTLWLKSWDQVPAGSLPDDDVDLCRLAEFGRNNRAWQKVKVVALRGWFKCADGRLYHSVVAEGVNEAWERKDASEQEKGNKNDRQSRWRARLKEISQQLRECGVTPPAGASLETLNRLLVDARETPTETGERRVIKGREGKGSSSEPKGSGAASAPELFSNPATVAAANGKHYPPGAKPDLKKQVYDRGKEVFGPSAGGIVTNVLKAKEHKYAKALALIEDAAEKRDPVSWINAWLWEHGPPGLQVGPMSPAL